MRIRGILLVTAALCAWVGCNSKDEPVSQARAQPEGPFEDGLEYTQEQMAADDPRTRIRGALKELGHDDEIPENASLAELETLLDQKVESGMIPQAHAKKLLKVLESADEHNKRLERMDQQLFGENAY